MAQTVPLTVMVSARAAVRDAEVVLHLLLGAGGPAGLGLGDALEGGVAQGGVGVGEGAWPWRQSAASRQDVTRGGLGDGVGHAGGDVHGVVAEPLVEPGHQGGVGGDVGGQPAREELAGERGVEVVDLVVGRLERLAGRRGRGR